MYMVDLSGLARQVNQKGDSMNSLLNKVRSADIKKSLVEYAQACCAENGTPNT